MTPSTHPLQRSLTGGVAADLAVDPAGKALLDFFAGGDLGAERERTIVQALRDETVREQILQRLRTQSMRTALQHTMRKLRA